jgi:hypothetical protein
MQHDFVGKRIFKKRQKQIETLRTDRRTMCDGTLFGLIRPDHGLHLQFLGEPDLWQSMIRRPLVRGF